MRRLSDMTTMEEVMYNELTALEESICKWNSICMGMVGDGGRRDCALCKVFFSLNCEGCSIYKRTWKTNCKCTPYDNWVRCIQSLYWITILQVKKTLPKMNKTLPPELSSRLVNYAEAELIFLLSLLPEGHRWRNQI